MKGLLVNFNKRFVNTKEVGFMTSRSRQEIGLCVGLINHKEGFKVIGLAGCEVNDDTFLGKNVDLVFIINDPPRLANPNELASLRLSVERVFASSEKCHHLRDSFKVVTHTDFIKFLRDEGLDNSIQEKLQAVKDNLERFNQLVESAKSAPPSPVKNVRRPFQ